MSILEFSNNMRYRLAINACIDPGNLDCKKPEDIRKYLQRALYGPQGTVVAAYKRAVDNAWDWEAGLKKTLPNGEVHYYPLAGHCSFWGSGAGAGTNLMFAAAKKLVEAHYGT